MSRIRNLQHPTARRLGVPAVLVTAALVLTPLPAAVAGFGESYGTDTPGAIVRSTAIADVNRDGRPDVVATTDLDQSVSVFLNVGNDHPLVLSAKYPDSGDQNQIAAGDLNGDGYPDLVVSTRDFLRVRLNNGAGAFGAAATYGADFFVYADAIGLADADGDGDTDILTSSVDGILALYRNTGTGTFAAAENYNLGQGADTLTVADVDGDGDLDAAAGVQSGVRMMLNDGAGHFVRGSSIEQDGQTFATGGDLDGDGVFDLVLMDFSYHKVQVFRGAGDGTFTAGQVFPSPQPSAGSVVDLDDDGDLDLLTSGGLSGAELVSTYLNDGEGHLVRNFAGEPDDYERQGLSVGDLNGDDLPDLVSSSRYGLGLNVNYGNGDEADPEQPVVTMTVDPQDKVRPGSTSQYNIASSGTDGVLVRVAATDLGQVRGLTCVDQRRQLTPGSPVQSVTVLDTSAAQGELVLTDSLHDVTCTATDGFNESEPVRRVIQVDQEAPAVEGTVTPNPVVVGTAATATALAADDSGTPTSSCAPPATGTVGEKTLTCTATDRFANASTVQVAYSVIPAPDTTPPVVTLAVDAADVLAPTGWFNRATSGVDGILVHVSAEDSAGVANLHCTVDGDDVLDVAAPSGSLVLGDGEHAVACTASDGTNTSAPQTLSAKVDQTGPEVSGTVTPNPVIQGDVATVTPDGDDATSGLVSLSCTNPDTSTIGDFVLTCSGTDAAGNETTVDVAYAVQVSPRKPLSVAVDATVTYGGGTPVLQVVPTGLVDGDTLAELDGSVTCALPAVTATTPAGTVLPIGECSGLASEKYAITYQPGTLTVLQAPLTLTVTGSQVYGSSAPTLTTAEALPSGVTRTGVLACTKLAGGTTINGALGAGAYTIDPTTCSGFGLGGPSAGNYRWELAGGSFTVAKAPVVVTTTSTSGLVNLLTLRITYASVVTNPVSGLPVPGVTVLTRPGGPVANGCSAVTNARGLATCTAGPITLVLGGSFTATAQAGPNTLPGVATSTIRPF